MDRLGPRPALLLVFALCVAALAWMQWRAQATVSLHAVGWAAATEHSAQAETTVAQVHVHPGELVQAGQPLVTLSALPLRREAQLLDAEITRTRRLADLERLRSQRQTWRDDLEAARLRTEARRELVQARSQEASARDRVQATERWEEKLAQRAQRRLTNGQDWEQAQRDLDWERAALKAARQQRSTNTALLNDLEALDAPDLLTETTQSYYQAELELLQRRRAHLAELLASLQIKARHGGRVQAIAAVGSPAAPGQSLVSLLPRFAPEVVAWFPPETNPASLTEGTPVTLRAGQRRCASAGQVVRVGASVQAAPPQLPAPLLGVGATTGLPVYITVPQNCPLGVGQLIQASLQASR
jgi:multidrug resistance efflux pump